MVLLVSKSCFVDAFCSQLTRWKLLDILVKKTFASNFLFNHKTKQNNYLSIVDNNGLTIANFHSEICLSVWEGNKSLEIRSETKAGYNLKQRAIIKKTCSFSWCREVLTECLSHKIKN